LHVFPFQENEKSPSQNRKAKDATSDNGKGETWFLLLVAMATTFISTWCQVQEPGECWHVGAHAKGHAGVLKNAF